MILENIPAIFLRIFGVLPCFVPRHISIFCLITCCSLAAHAQRQVIIDSLQAVLKGAVGGEGYETLYELAFEYLPQDKAKALEWIDEAQRIAVRHSFKFELLSIELGLGLIRLWVGRYNKALLQFISAQTLAVRSSNPDYMIGAPVGILQLYKRPGKGFYYQTRYLDMRDSIYSDDLIHSLMQAEGAFRQRENEAKIASQAQLLNLNTELLKRQTMLNILTGTVFALAVIVIFFLFKDYRRNKAINVLLDEQVRRRTRELEVSRQELSSTQRQQVLTIRRALTRIAEQMMTVRGAAVQHEVSGVTQMRVTISKN